MMASSTSNHQEESPRPTAKLVNLKGGYEKPPSPGEVRDVMLYDRDIYFLRRVRENGNLVMKGHANIEYVDKKWFIRDLSGTGLCVVSRDPERPLTVDITQLVKGVLKELKHGDILHLVANAPLIYQFEWLKDKPQSTGLTDAA